jgi:membrane protein DedA with SNARE-associated domain
MIVLFGTEAVAPVPSDSTLPTAAAASSATVDGLGGALLFCCEVMLEFF